MEICIRQLSVVGFDGFKLKSLKLKSWPKMFKINSDLYLDFFSSFVTFSMRNKVIFILWKKFIDGLLKILKTTVFLRG